MPGFEIGLRHAKEESILFEFAAVLRGIGSILVSSLWFEFYGGLIRGTDACGGFGLRQEIDGSLVPCYRYWTTSLRSPSSGIAVLLLLWGTRGLESGYPTSKRPR